MFYTWRGVSWLSRMLSSCDELVSESGCGGGFWSNQNSESTGVFYVT